MLARYTNILSSYIRLKKTGQQVGFSQVGNLRLAMNHERMDEYFQYAATAKTIT